MKYRCRIIALSLLATLSLLLTMPVEGQETIQWLHGTKDFEKATKQARAEKKLLLLDFFHPH